MGRSLSVSLSFRLGVWRCGVVLSRSNHFAYDASGGNTSYTGRTVHLDVFRSAGVNYHTGITYVTEVTFSHM